MITFEKTPKTIDLCQSGMPFKVAASAYIITAGVRGDVTFNRTAVLFSEGKYFFFWDFEEGHIFYIYAKNSPDENLNEIPADNPAATAEENTAAVEQNLRNLPIFNKYYTIVRTGTSLKITVRPLAGIDLSVFSGCLDAYTITAHNNGENRAVRDSLKFISYLTKFLPIEEIVSEQKFDPDYYGKVDFEIGMLVKPYVPVNLPSLSAPSSSFEIFKYRLQAGQEYNDGNGVPLKPWLDEFSGYALNGKNVEGYDLWEDITDNKIFLNTLKEIDIYADCNYMLNLIDITAYVGMIWAKIYYTDGTSTEQLITSAQAQTLYEIYSFTANIEKMFLNSYQPAKEIYKYEVWIKDSVGNILANKATFNVIPKPMHVKEFAYLNKYGVMDFFFATSKTNIATITEKTTINKADGSISDSFIESHETYKVSTGSMSDEDILELKYFLSSEQFYEIINGAYVKCIIEPGTYNIIEESANITSIDFSYRKAKE